MGRTGLTIKCIGPPKVKDEEKGAQESHNKGTGKL